MRLPSENALQRPVSCLYGCPGRIPLSSPSPSRDVSTGDLGSARIKTHRPEGNLGWTPGTWRKSVGGGGEGGSLALGVWRGWRRPRPVGREALRTPAKGPAPPPHLHVGHEALLDSPAVLIDLFQELQLIIITATHGGENSASL